MYSKSLAGGPTGVSLSKMPLSLRSPLGGGGVAQKQAAAGELAVWCVTGEMPFVVCFEVASAKPL